MTVVRSALPVRSPYPLMHPWTWSAPWPHSNQRIGYGTARVVVEMDPEATRGNLARLGYDPLHLMGQHPAIRVAQHRRSSTFFDHA